MKCLISETAGKDAVMGFGLAEIPAMPGCIAVADSFAELKVNLIEAIRCWVATQGDLARSRTARREAVMARRQSPTHNSNFSSMGNGIMSDKRMKEEPLQNLPVKYSVADSLRYARALL